MQSRVSAKNWSLTGTLIHQGVTRVMHDTHPRIYYHHGAGHLVIINEL